MKSFKDLGNEPYYDFSDAAVLSQLEKAKKTARKWLGKTHPLEIDGKKVWCRETFDDVNPADATELVGRFPLATAEQVREIVGHAQTAFEKTWGETIPVEKRAKTVRRVAELAAKRKMVLSVVLAHETGKSMLEACADVAEFIDFARAYSEQALSIEREDQGLLKVKGHKLLHRHRPFGVGVVIGPFNFPIAITCGLGSATLVTGNTLVLKPSSDAPLIAHLVRDLYREAGLPKNAFNIVTGSGADIGDVLLTHPDVKLVSFTGSVETGLHIREIVNKRPKPGEWLKTIPALEMGGKNATLVDANVSIDKAVDAVLAGAFGYNGQKCSACSRAYVHASLYDEFREKIVAKTRALKIGPGTDPENYVTAVINANAKKKILKYIAIGKKEGGKILCGGAALEKGAFAKGFFVQPTILENPKRGGRVEMEEIFGPVLALFKVKSFEEGLARVRNCRYGLTGSVLTNNASHKKAASSLPIGDFYINRKCTGAYVGREPFGGVKFSGPYGTGPGGKDFLRRFYWTQSVSETL